jgi:hypothetical protein
MSKWKFVAGAKKRDGATVRNADGEDCPQLSEAAEKTDAFATA